jgi:hypothetical protein
VIEPKMMNTKNLINRFGTMMMKLRKFLMKMEVGRAVSGLVKTLE